MIPSTQSDEITEAVSQWVIKETKQLENSSLRIALLAVIKKHQHIDGIYGYSIGRALSEYTLGELDGSNAKFYAILRRLEKDKLVTSKLTSSTIGPARKHYFLTEKGERALNALWQNWIYYYDIINQLITGDENE